MSAMPPPPEIMHVPVPEVGRGSFASAAVVQQEMEVPNLASLGSVVGEVGDIDSHLNGLAPPPVLENDNTSIEQISGVATDIVTQTPSPNLSKSEISVSSNDPIPMNLNINESLVMSHFGVPPATGPLAEFAAASPFSSQQQTQPHLQQQLESDNSQALPPPPVLDELPTSDSFSNRFLPPPPIDSHYAQGGDDEDEVAALPPA